MLFLLTNGVTEVALFSVKNPKSEDISVGWTYKQGVSASVRATGDLSRQLGLTRLGKKVEGALLGFALGKKMIHNTMEQISIGSVVKLKSGGPQMTVRAYGTKLKVGSMLGASVEDTEQVQCQWFDVAETLQEGLFPVASLTLD